MSFKLDKKEREQRDELVDKLRTAWGEVEAHIDHYNEEVNNILADVNEAIGKYNAVVAEAKQFVEDVHSQAEQDFGERSEKWQEGEKGQQVQEWITSWESLASDLDDLEERELEELDSDEPEHAQMLEDIEAESEQAA